MKTPFEIVYTNFCNLADFFENGMKPCLLEIKVSIFFDGYNVMDKKILSKVKKFRNKNIESGSLCLNGDDFLIFHF